MRGLRRTTQAGTVLVIVGTALLAGCGQPQATPLPCMERAVFGDPAQSPYVLPYPSGTSCKLIQAYCYPYGGHSNQLAYDFQMPVGDAVTATRGGIVKRVKGDLPDDGREPESGQHNHILIEHDDGTVAFYAHLQQNSLTVAVGDTVIVGQHIANSGNSGNTLGVPHLHFGVYQDWPAVEGFDLPVNFRNAEGPLDERGGLKPGTIYKALPY